jgi:hypothetical protein
MKIWIALAVIVLFGMGLGLLRWPRRSIGLIFEDFSWMDALGFALLGIAVLMIFWARSA